MNHTGIFAAFLALTSASAAALAQSPNVSSTPGTATSTNAMMRGGATTAGATGSAQPLAASDRSFIRQAAAGGLTEVQAAQIAQQQSSSDKVKQFAAQMITDHQKANQQLIQIATSKGVTPPSTPDQKQQKELARLQALNGTKFDKMYMKGQVRDHQDQVQVFQSEINNGKDPDLKNFAQQTLPIIQNHLQEAQNGGR